MRENKLWVTRRPPTRRMRTYSLTPITRNTIGPCCKAPRSTQDRRLCRSVVPSPGRRGEEAPENETSEEGEDVTNLYGSFETLRNQFPHGPRPRPVSFSTYIDTGSWPTARGWTACSPARLQERLLSPVQHANVSNCAQPASHSPT